MQPTLQKILLEYEPHPRQLLAVLKRVNSLFGYVSQEKIYPIADYFSLSPAEVFNALSFYDDLRITPKPNVEIKVCLSAPCEMRGASKVLREIERFLGAKTDRDKTAKLEIRSASCQGRCQRGPLVIVNDNVYEQVKSEGVDDILAPYFAK
jgi:NADH:ubiquinone oxidoreductase subunit E